MWGQAGCLLFRIPVAYTALLEEKKAAYGDYQQAKQKTPDAAKSVIGQFPTSVMTLAPFAGFSAMTHLTG